MSFIPYFIFFLFLVVIGIAVSLYKVKKAQRATQINHDISLKKEGKRILVDFSQCEIKSRVFYEDLKHDNFPTWIEIIDSLGHKNNREKKIRKEVSEILFEHVSGTKKYIYRSNPIYMPETTLRFKLLTKGSTHIYVDSDNESRYFFDLEFLQ